MVVTYKHKFNAKYGFQKDEAHSVAEISKLTGYKKSGLETIVQKGRGAFFSNPGSVRPNVTGPDMWGRARLYSAIMGGKAARIDAKQLIKE
jgi:hypothetical protein